MPLLLANTNKNLAPKRLVIIGNPYGMHPESFFPKNFGKDYKASLELECLEWIRKRLTVYSHIDHNMESGHNKEEAFLSGILLHDAARYPDGNITIDQMIGEYLRSEVRFPTLNTSAGPGILESWTRTGVPAPILNINQLYRQLFVDSSQASKKAEKKLWNRNQDMLSILKDQYKDSTKNIGKEDKERMDQYLTSVSELNREIDSKHKWQNKQKPKFSGDKNATTLQEKYNTIFDMLTIALQSDSTRVATVTFSKSLETKDLGLSGGYHSYTHNGKAKSGVKGMRAIDTFQLEQMSRFMKKLDSIKEPNSNGTLLDNTIVMFGSSMGYGGTHSNRNLPIIVCGGGLKHKGHVNMKQKNGSNTPLCNLYLSFLHKFGIERDVFNASTGTIEI